MSVVCLVPCQTERVSLSHDAVLRKAVHHLALSTGTDDETKINYSQHKRACARLFDFNYPVLMLSGWAILARSNLLPYLEWSSCYHKVPVTIDMAIFFQ